MVFCCSSQAKTKCGWDSWVWFLRSRALKTKNTRCLALMYPAYNDKGVLKSKMASSVLVRIPEENTWSGERG